MALPKQIEISLPLLELLKDRKVHHVEELAKRLEDHFGLSEEERSLQKSSGGEGLFHNRIRWSNFYLRKAGLIESAKGTGNSKITLEGLALLKENPKIIDVDVLLRYPSYVEYRKSVTRK